MFILRQVVWGIVCKIWGIGTKWVKCRLMIIYGGFFMGIVFTNVGETRLYRLSSSQPVTVHYWIRICPRVNAGQRLRTYRVCLMIIFFYSVILCFIFAFCRILRHPPDDTA